MINLNNNLRNNPEWEFKGFQFLVQNNPKKYELQKSSYMEGMISIYKLIDKSNKLNNQVGNIIYYSNVKKTYMYGTNKENQNDCK